MLRRREKRRYLTVLVKREEVEKLSIYSKNSSNSQESKTPSTNGSKTVQTKPIVLAQRQQQTVSSLVRNNVSILKNNKQNNFNLKKEENQAIDPSKILLKIIKKRFSELFGYIELEKSNIQIIHVKKIKIDDIFVVKCNLFAIDKLLFTLLMCRPLITTLKTSGTLRNLISEIDSTIIIFNQDKIG